MKKITDERMSELIAELKGIKKESNSDVETGHIYADDFIIKFLKEIGYGKIARLYDSVHKWYS